MIWYIQPGKIAKDFEIGKNDSKVNVLTFPPDYLYQFRALLLVILLYILNFSYANEYFPILGKIDLPSFLWGKETISRLFVNAFWY